MAAYALVMAADFEAVDAELGRMLRDARERGSVFGYAGVGLLSGQVALQRGELRAAAAHFESALTAARSLEASPVTMRCVAFARSWLIEALLHRGDAAGARAIVQEAAAAGDFERTELIWSRYGRGLFRLLAEVDMEGAADDLLAFGDAARAGGYEDREAPWRAWAALALSAAGNGTEATTLADEQLRIASAWSPTARGAALRVRALVGPPAEAEPLLDESVALLAESGRRLEHARALVDHGVALRRAGRRRDARATLESGLDLAARCEATPLAQRAREELVILGSRPRRMMFSGVESLTATERRVADMAADGMTNREIAQALFVTLKTVEVHLSQSYRKLGIGSRRQLSEALGAREPVAAAGQSG
jgi:DNA-binding CsgD family transcriptional regulator